jgi:geranyl-CoA carboxylase alpha subunit
MIHSLLIANRGEIACRIIRTARRMGIATVAVYSDADADALHVRMADRAIRIGGPAAAESYLRIDAIIEAAKTAGAEAVHPGYGFLSENAGFAEACAAAGLIFVGPPVKAIRAMGDKGRAKALMRAADVPVVPGYDGEDQASETLTREAGRVGYPMLVKAAAGGGGRGMRTVRHPGDLAAAIDSARREAESAFGDGRLLLERLVEDARHIEVQIFADAHGSVVHLGERDCSTQRRHQKIIEETPSPLVDDAMRAAITGAAIAAARAVDYVGAGTVEFIAAADRNFFFLEMNTRLQVEHPVTEMVTGLDLVEWQLRVAAGEPLPLGQDDITFTGHAIEARLCAEVPAAGFAPQAGTVLRWRPDDAAGASVRIDHGLVEGGEVTPFYDPMVAKVIGHGSTRGEAIGRVERALKALPVFGVGTNRAFLLDLLSGAEFREGHMTTGHVDGAAIDAHAPRHRDFALAAALLATAGGGDWFSTSGQRRWPVTLQAGDDKRKCVVVFERGGLVGVEVGGLDGGGARQAVSNDELAVPHTRDGQSLWLDRDGVTFRFEQPDPLRRAVAAAGDGRLVVSPVSGLLRHVGVSSGDWVRAGDLIAVVEAMKMETPLLARADGAVVSIRAVGGQVRAGDIVAEIEG